MSKRLHHIHYKADPDKVIATIIRNPCATYQQIGDKYGLSRERIRQIKVKYALPHVKSRRKNYVCLNCGKVIANCNHNYCNRKCWHEYTHPLIECYQCHMLFRIKQSRLIRQSSQIQAGNNKLQEHIFCSNKCKGIFRGNTYGFVAHPENTRHKRKVL